MLIDRWLDKAAVVHTDNGILLSHKLECIWVSSHEVDELEPTDEESQKEKNMYHKHIYGS